MSDSEKSSRADGASAAAAGPKRTHRRSTHHTLLFGLKRHRRKAWWLVAMVALGILAAGLVWRYTDIQWASVNGWIGGLNPIAVLPLMALLPIVGFPISVVYLVAGARFGPVAGGVVVAGVTLVHLLGTYLIARSFLRAPLQRFIERRHAHLPHIPEDEQAAVCLIAVLVPGLPYVIRNYLLALADVKLRYYLGVCLPVYVARSYVTILLGDMSNDPTRFKIIALITVDLLKVLVCGIVIWRLREHHRKFHGHEHDHDSGPASDAAVPPSAAA